MVSVVIPCFNASETIESCLNSVLNQTYKDIELVIVDDGSTDESVEIINKIINSNEDSVIRLHEQSNSGPSTARNKGVLLSRGEYIAFLDADDEWAETKLSEQIEILKTYQCPFVGTLSQKKGEPFNNSTSPIIQQIDFNKLLYKNYYTTSSVLCKRECFNSLCFNENQRYSEDYRLWLMISLYVGSGVLYHKCLTFAYNKYLGEKGLSSKLWKMEKGELKNYSYFFSRGEISVIKYTIISLYSFLKFLRRVLMQIRLFK